VQELKIQEEEMSRLSARIKSQGYDLKDVQAINDHLEAKQAELGQILKQRDYEVFFSWFVYHLLIYFSHTGLLLLYAIYLNLIPVV